MARDGPEMPCLTADLTNTKKTSRSWKWMVSTHLHRDLHWCLTASSSQGIYQSWHHNRPQLLCQTVHPWNEKQTALMHPAYNQAGGGAAASPPCQETRVTQCLAGFMAKAWDWCWEAPQTAVCYGNPDLSGWGFFSGTKMSETCKGCGGHLWRRKKWERSKLHSWGRGEDEEVLMCC